MKNIAFVIYYHRDNFYSLNAIVGALETDKIFDAIDFFFAESDDVLYKILEKTIGLYNKIIVGISFYTTQLFEIRELVHILKNRFKEKCIIIAGGPHPTGDPFGTLKMGFDVVVVGEGEETIIEFMQKINSNEDFYSIKGIAYIDSEKEYYYTGKRDLINLNNYRPFPIKITRFGAIEITRGCPYVCYFCQTPYILGTSPRHRSIKKICEYVEELKAYYGDLTFIRFISPNAFSYGSEDGKKLNLEKLQNLLLNVREIIGTKGKIFIGTYPSEVRPEHVNEETLNLILKYANNDNITIGAQSGSQRILDLCHRGHTVEDIYNATKLALKANLNVNLDFIFGLPGEKKEDIELSIKLMKEISNERVRIHTHMFIPLPQTPFAKKPVRYINQTYKKEIEKLISKGFAFGEWRKQEKLAFKIAKYLNR
ncbi:MAG: TIGR04013 family B12-binding domain/radical SAM domain-containing protein [Candidatus Hermodarchaeota archaeon]